MSYKTAVAHLFDRPGGRWLLGKIATPYVRKVLRSDLQIAHRNGLWTHRMGSIVFPDGPNFKAISSNFGQWRTQAEQYASDATEFWFKYYSPKHGDVIVDVGAGRGEDTLTFSRAVGDTGRVIAIEANPLSFAILKSFCLFNGLKNVSAINVALMDNPGIVHLLQDESSWKQDSIGHGQQSSGIKIQAATLQQIWEQEKVSELSFLKMNIEGGERHALLGMERLLPFIPQICVACHDFRSEQGDGAHFRTRAFVEEFLSRHGYSVASDPDDPRDYVRDHLFGMRVDDSSSDRQSHKTKSIERSLSSNPLN